VLFEILDKAVFCAHNVNFDYAFIRAEFKRLGIVFQKQKLCTVKLSRALFPKERKHNLDAVIERMEIECGNRHRALDDAETLVSFYNKLLERFSVKKLEKIINKMIGSTTLPTKLLEININNAVYFKH
jgi:DNA polymerase-3 subunit epsilon